MRFVKRFFLLLAIFMPLFMFNVKANEQLEVKVAYHTVPNYQNGSADGVKSGWGYDYYQAISNYANIKFTYVKCENFSDSLRKLRAGEVDVMGNLSYTLDRAQDILYSKNPQGEEEYYIYALADNEDITVEPHSLVGKRCSVNKDSVQESIFDEYIGNYNISVEKVYNSVGYDKINYLVEGKADFSVSTQMTSADVKNNRLKQLNSIGSSYYYFGISKASANSYEILKRFDDAQSKILSISPNYNSILKDSYVVEGDITNTELTQNEIEYLSSKGVLKVGIIDENLPLSDLSTVKNNDAFKGTMIDSLNKMSEVYGITIEYCGYKNEGELILAVKNGDIDVATPVGLSLYEAESLDVSIARDVLNSNVRLYYINSYSPDKYSVAAVEKGNTSIIYYYETHYPNVVLKEYETIFDCIKAVEKGECDFTLALDTWHNYYFSLNHDELQKVKSVPLQDKVSIGYATKRCNGILIGILNKGIGLFDEQFITESLIENSQYQLTYSFSDIVKNNAPLAITIIVTVAFIVITVILISYFKNKKLVTILRKDELTGIYIGNYFYLRMRKMLAENQDREYDFIVSDISNFKTYNEQYGNKEADKLLYTIASYFRTLINDECVLGKIGIDQFGLLIPHERNVYEYVKDKFTLSFMNTFVEQMNVKSFELKFGVYENVDKALECERIRDRAIVALEEVKGSHSNYIHKYDDRLKEEAIWTQWIYENMYKGIENKEFEVWFQPKHALSDNSVVGAEALVRWRNKDKGLISPGLFIPLFEKNGFISELDRYVIDETCQRIKEMKSLGVKTVPISINLSRIDLVKNDCAGMINPIIEKYGITSSDIHIEITESAYSEETNVILNQLKNLHESGYVIEMDDFGTGYSNLNMFGEMNVDVIKLDMKFIQQNESEQNDKLIKYIINMSKALDLVVVAEGVETKAQRDKLQEMGCDIIQGYYYSRPLPYNEFLEYIKTK